MPLHNSNDADATSSLPSSGSHTAGDVTLAFIPDMATSLPKSDKPLPVPSSPSTEPDPLVRWTIPAALLQKFPADTLLDLTSGNYRTWQRRIQDVLIVVGDLARYLESSYSCPSRSTHLLDARVWTQNDQHVQGFLRLQCSDDELEIVRTSPVPLSSAAALWEFLRVRHLNRGPHAQVLLLRDLLQLRFVPSNPLVPQTHHAINICRQIITMGPLTVDSLAKVTLLHMMRDVLPQLQRAIAQDLVRATAAAPYTIADLVKHIEMEQGLRQEESSSTPSGSGLSTDLALAAQPSGRPLVLCGNCKRKGHVAADCYQPGGAMEGRRAEVDVRIAERRAGRGRGRGGGGGSAPTPASTTTRRVFDATGQAYLVSDTALSAATAPAAAAPSVLLTTAHSAIIELPSEHVDLTPAPAWLTDLATDGDSFFEAHVATPCEWDTASWDASSPVGSDVALAAIATDPFLFDSGATAHISPHRSDFEELTPTDPRGIRGVNGGLIYATGVGTIRLPLESGKSLVLTEALHVPASTVRLISVRALCDGPHGYSVAFTSSGVSVRHSVMTSRRVSYDAQW
ncbi:hypothetical protein BN946_scf184622.g1 [Trametes cinnabarina]|uniref:CCHC-type domain-containing protein n=1 Tax=Pycnoporus cinnabarinus TaxID=5643 RepID=A0A060SVI6_PYCCI|nr:hypothetical protein BN946_scf184622.g1 [Trametes cinnabarina]